MNILKIFYTACALALGGVCAATDFCVSTAAQLQGALIAAELNTQADHIKVVKGFYPTTDLGTGGGFTYQTDDEADALEISGGWSLNASNQCVRLRQPTQVFHTTLSGQGQHRVMVININHRIPHLRIRDLTFSNGWGDYSLFEDGGGLHIDADLSGNRPMAVLIENNAFIGNEARFGAGLYVAGSERLWLVNNLFQFNDIETGGAAYIAQGNQFGVYVTNNTFLSNSVNDPGPSLRVGGLWLQVNGTSQAMLANNLLWLNDAVDLHLAGNGEEFVYHNNISSAIPASAEHLQNNLSLDPQLGAFYEPEITSPLINAGIRPPSAPQPMIPFEHNWYVTEQDYIDRTRVVDWQVDIGAVEQGSDLISRRHFQTRLIEMPLNP